MWIVLTGVVSSVGMAAYQDKLVSGAAVVMEQKGMTQGISENMNFENMANNKAMDFFLSVPWVDLLVSFIFFFIGGLLLHRRVPYLWFIVCRGWRSRRSGSRYTAIYAASDTSLDICLFNIHHDDK